MGTEVTELQGGPAGGSGSSRTGVPVRREIWTRRRTRTEERQPKTQGEDGHVTVMPLPPRTAGKFQKLEEPGEDSGWSCGRQSTPCARLDSSSPGPRTERQCVSGVDVDLTFAVVRYNIQLTMSAAVRVQLSGVQHNVVVVQSRPSVPRVFSFCKTETRPR